MDPLSIAASAAGLLSLGITVAQSLVDFYSSYKHQKSDVAHTIEKLERLLDVLNRLRAQLEKRAFRADEQPLLDNIERSIRACEECIQELENECQKFKRDPADGIRATIRTAGRRLAYPLRESTLQKLDEDVDEILSSLSLALQLLQQEDVSHVRNDIEDTKALLKLVRADQISSKVRDWLKAPDATVNYHEACKKRHSGTGLWFVKGASFSAWLAEPNSFLWLYGFAGCGKSVLCSTAIQYAFRHRKGNPRVGIAFFFFTFNDVSKQDVSAMLRALVLQLSGQLHDNHGLLSRLCDSYPSATPPDQALVDCLHQLVRMFDDAYIIVDALDESPRGRHRQDVLQALVDLRAWAEPRLHLLVTSRDEPDIRDVVFEEIGALQGEAVPLRNASVDRDIASFVSRSLREDRRLRRWENYHDQIETALTKGAHGVYVFRFLQRKLLTRLDFAGLNASLQHYTLVPGASGTLTNCSDHCHSLWTKPTNGCY